MICTGTIRIWQEEIYMREENIYGVILAGGNGSRLWPLSRELYPKQLLKFNQKNSLLQSTFLRLNKFIDDKNIITVTNSKHSADVKIQLSELAQELRQHEDYILLEESIGRNTAPAIILALLYILNISNNDKNDPIIFIAPSDHLIQNIDISTRIFENSIILAKEGYIVTFGIVPDSPNTGYGYIKTQQNDLIHEISQEGLKVIEFKEKPDIETAKKYVDEGIYYWNSGIFVFKASAMLTELKKYCPKILESLQEITADSNDFRIPIEKYCNIENISIDYALMEHSKKIAMIPLDCGWNDLGSWEAVFDMFDKDENNNVISGNVADIGSKNSLILSQSKFVGSIGLDNIVVVETDDAILISDKNKTQEVKKIFDKLHENGDPQSRVHKTVYRPWGFYTVLNSGDGYLTKLIHVNPQERLSLQMHNYRSEHWVVLSGEATVIKGEEAHILNIGESIDIQVKEKHSLQNNTDEDVEILEVQQGNYLEEEDIVRFEDIYNRI